MKNDTFEKIVASLSRAIGNDLLSYEKHEDVHTLSIWPPITGNKKKLLVEFLKDYIGPKGKIRVNSRQGRVTIWFSKKRTP
tara:strand:+ start:2301 stop:2543 length:243 start_codon:yes stop_codon:yes gene_type:complete